MDNNIVKFEVKVGTEFELKFETDENKTPYIILTNGLIVIIMTAAIYGMSSGDYHVFDSTKEIIDKGLNIIGTVVKTANIKITS